MNLTMCRRDAAGKSATGFACWLWSLMLLMCVGCSTYQIDWNSRIGTYTYDQAVSDLGPPDKSAKLTDGTIVAEWLTRRGYSRGSVGFAYGYGSPFHPYYCPPPFYHYYYDPPSPD